jgi:hypothetical protein
MSLIQVHGEHAEARHHVFTRVDRGREIPERIVHAQVLHLETSENNRV